MNQKIIDKSIGYLEPPRRAVLMTSDMWFPGSVLHEVEVLELTDTWAKVKGTKRRLGFLWKVSKESWEPKSNLEYIP